MPACQDLSIFRSRTLSRRSLKIRLGIIGFKTNDAGMGGGRGGSTTESACH